jgi:ABC-type dipeptide/oligopeptide/nickel transport system ATPase component
VPTQNAEHYQVVFARTLDRSARASPGIIMVAPSTDSWNDFGFRIRVDIVIYPRASSDLEMEAWTSAYLGFTGTASRHGDTRDLLDALGNAALDSITPEKLPAFFTMLPDLNTYRELVARLGASETLIALTVLHDVVAGEDAATVPIWLKAAKESAVFYKGFLRLSESYFAWKNAGPILQGEEFEELGRLSDTLRINFQLAGRTNEHKLEFKFAPRERVLPKRFAVIIGKNGVGKSQALGRIARSALNGTGELTDGEGRRPELNRLLAFYPTAPGASVFPSQRRRGARLWYRRFPLASPGVGRHRQTTSDIIIQLARSTERIAGSERLNIFFNALRAIEGHETLGLSFRRDAPGACRILDLDRGGEEQRLDRFAAIDIRREPVRISDEREYGLSSGELAFVRFAALASLYIENGSLLLFDEPETHLHPNFISQFVVLLDNLLAQTGSAAIISTHSVYFVREAFEDQVQVLRSGPAGEVDISPPRLKTFGANVGAISYFVFGEDEPSRLAKQVETRLAQSANSWREVFEIYRDELSLDLLSDIRAQIEGRIVNTDDR